MKIWWLSLFPELLRENLRWGVLGSAIENKIFEVSILNPRDFSASRYGATDDRPFGGGDGMVQMAEPWAACLEASRALDEKPCRLLMPSPAGKPWSAKLAREFALERSNLVFFCGRYSGFDERLIQRFGIEEYSLGDYVVSGGEWPSLIMFDSIARFCPGVLGHEESANLDSFEGEGFLEPPLFTRPQEWRSQSVPEFLISGHHARIEKINTAVALVRTYLRRADLTQDRPQIIKAAKLLSALPVKDLQTLGFLNQDLDRILGDR